MIQQAGPIRRLAIVLLACFGLIGGPARADDRPDTTVLHPKDGEVLSVRLPTQGQLFIVSLIPWAVTGGKEGQGLEVNYDVRGIQISHLGNDPSKVSFTLRLVDGRTITLNVRTANMKIKTAYAVIA